MQEHRSMHEASMTTPLYALLAELRRDSAEQLREVRRHRFFVGPSERRRLKSRRAQERAHRTARPRPLPIVIRPIHTLEVK